MVVGMTRVIVMRVITVLALHDGYVRRDLRAGLGLMVVLRMTGVIMAFGIG
jgi:hypothetical protein